MATTQYIGARYVPVFADPAEWNDTRTYEPLTIVLHEGNSYTSKQFVPIGINITNEKFWAETGNYNAQVEQYRQEVKTYDDRITANADAITTEKNRAVAAEKVNSDAINVLNNVTNGNILIIGDSYSEGYSPKGTLNSFAHQTKALIEANTQRKVYLITKGGHSFAQGTWTNDLTEWASSQSQDVKDSITHVYICGGANDRHSSDSTIASAIKTFFTAARTLLKNANYTVMFIGAGCYGLATQHTDVNNLAFNTVVNSYAYNAIIYGYRFVNGSGIIKFNKYFSSDYFHPNQNGQNWLAASLLNVIYGGEPITWGERNPQQLYKGTPDLITTREDELKATSGNVELSVSCIDTFYAGAMPWNNYKIDKLNIDLFFDASDTQWSFLMLPIATLPYNAIYQAPYDPDSDYKYPRYFKCSVYYVQSGRTQPTGVAENTYYSDTADAIILGNVLYLNCTFVQQNRISGEPAYANKITHLTVSYNNWHTLPDNLPVQ